MTPEPAAVAEPLHLEQWLAGREFARRDPIAPQLRNQQYLVGDPATRGAYLVDPCWDIDGLLQRVADGGWTLSGVLLTHAHPDHVGGRWMGMDIEGVERLIERAPVPVWMNRAELPVLEQVAGLGPGDLDLRLVDDGDEIPLGEHRIATLHTPGHSPGGQVFLIGDDRAIVGDTLFVGAIGRLDLPGSDPRAMGPSLARLGALPPATRIYPGHDYGRAPSSTIGEELDTNPYLQAAMADPERWLELLGHL